MRKSRIVEKTAAYYHVISRVVGREYVFGEEERERFRSTMRRVEAFCAVQIQTWCVLSNPISAKSGWILV